MYEMNEEKKEVEVSQVRLENIKLKNRLKKQECLLKQKVISPYLFLILFFNFIGCRCKKAHDQVEK